MVEAVTVDQIIARLARCQERIKVLRDDNQRLWESREEWKRKHASRQAEVQTLRRRVQRLDEARLRWKALAPTASRNLPVQKNIHLTEQDLAGILRMRVRD